MGIVSVNVHFHGSETDFLWGRKLGPPPPPPRLSVGKKVETPSTPPRKGSMAFKSIFHTYDLRIVSDCIDFDGGGGGGGGDFPSPLVFSFSFEAIPTSVFQKTSDLKETCTAEY